MTNESAPTKKPPTRSALRLWLKRIFLAFFALLLLIVIFHRPLLRWTLDVVGPYAAQKAGYDVSWRVSGNIDGNLVIDDLRVRGPASGALQRLSAGHIAASYDITQLWEGGASHMVHSLDMSDVEATIDARHPSPEKPETKKPDNSLPDYWVPHLHLRNIHARILKPDGQDIVVSGLTLLLDDGAKGELAIDELTLPSAKIHWTNVHGKTEVHGQQVTITDLTLTPDLKIPKLVVDLKDRKSGVLPFDFVVRSGEAVVAAAGKAWNFATGLQIKATLNVSELSSAELGRWVPLPDNMSWMAHTLTLKAEGSPLDPQMLRADLSLIGSYSIGAVHCDGVQLKANIESAMLHVQSLTVHNGPNEIDLAADSPLPPTWGGMSRLSADGKIQIAAPKVEDFFKGVPPVAGGVSGNGSISLRELKLTAAQLSLQGTHIQAQKYKVESLKADVNSDGKSLHINALHVRLDDQNTAQVSGDLLLSGDQPTHLEWKAELKRLSTALSAVGLSDVPAPESGTLTADGTVSVPMEELKAGHIDKLLAKGTAEVKNLVWQGKELDSLSLGFGMKDGKVELSNLDAKISDKNTVHASGSLLLADRQPAHVQWKMELADLPAVVRWAGIKDKPLPSSGLVNSQGEAQVNIADLKEKKWDQLVASTVTEITNLQWEKGHLDRAVIEVEARKGQAELKQLVVRFDEANQITATGNMALNDGRAFTADLKAALPKLKELGGWLSLAKAPALTSGNLALHWKGSGQVTPFKVTGDGAVDLEDLRLEGKPDVYVLRLKTLNEGTQAKISDLHAEAGKFHLDGSAAVSETDLSIPQLTLTSGTLHLLDLKAAIPLALAATPRPAVPVDPKRPVQLQVHMAKLRLADLFGQFGMKPPVKGEMSADIDFHNPLPELTGGLKLDLEDVQAAALEGKLSSAKAKLELTLVDHQLHLKSTVHQPPLRDLTIDASLPLNVEKVMANPKEVMEAPLQAKVVLPDSDLTIAKQLVPKIARIQGTAGMEVDLSGPVRAPQWKGSVHVNVPSAGLHGVPMDIKDGKVRLSFEGQKLKVDEASVVLAGGTIRIGGDVTLAPLADPAMNLRLDAGQALILRDNTMSLRADANITCVGTLKKAEVAGQVFLVRGRVFKEIEYLPLSLPNSLPPPPPAVTAPATKDLALPPPFTDWTFNVDISTRDPIRLMGNVLNGAAVVDLHIRGNGAAPTEYGTIKLKDSNVQLPFSRLAISRGVITFDKDHPLEPTIDLQGDALVNNYEVTVYAYGSAFSPKTRFTSSPPLSEGEIATLLATGSTAGDSRSAENVAANAAAFLVISRLYRSLFDKAAPKRYNQEPPKLSFSFSPLDTSGNGRSVTAIYEINPKLQVQGTVTDRGTFRGLLYYLFRFH